MRLTRDDLACIDHDIDRTIGRRGKRSPFGIGRSDDLIPGADIGDDHAVEAARRGTLDVGSVLLILGAVAGTFESTRDFMPSVQASQMNADIV